MQFFDAVETARLLGYRRLIDVLAGVLAEYERREIFSPERLVMPCGDDRGVLLSMPCRARDLVAHKLLTIYSGNPAAGLPAIEGHVSCFNAENGTPLFCLDGPTVTARRTAAITMIGIQRLMPRTPKSILLIGTGAQARAHVEAMSEIYPETVISIQGRSIDAVAAFCARTSSGRVRPADRDTDPAIDVVVAATSSKTPVYDEIARPDRLVIGVGAFRLDMREIGTQTIIGSQVYVDDLVGAPGEAGDVAHAGTDWAMVRPLAAALTDPPDFSRPIFLKSVGCAAWDLAACRSAQGVLASR